MQSDNNNQEMDKSLQTRNAKNYCLNILTKKDYTVAEIKTKLKAKDFESVVIKEVIDLLIELKFVDDQRLAQNLIMAYQGTKGKMWIVQKMRLRGLGQEVIEQAFEEFRNDNLSHNLQDGEQADALSPNRQIKLKLEKKYAIENWQEIDQNTKQKVVGFLARNGFGNPFGVVKGWQEEG